LVFFQSPLVKSGNACGAPSFSIELALSGVTALQKHPS